jgi:hypothetical protein
MTASQKPKFSPEYKMILYQTMVRSVEHQMEQVPPAKRQRLSDARFLAQRHLKDATDAVAKGEAEHG